MQRVTYNRAEDAHGSLIGAGPDATHSAADDRALRQLYMEIRDWGRELCGSNVAERKIEAVNPRSPLFRIGKEYAKDQVGRTGVNWFDEQGELGKSGKNLEKILNCLECTLFPPRQIRLSGGCTVRQSHSNRTTVYTTDICPCFRSCDEAAKSHMTEDAIGRGFLDRELRIVKPKVVLLLGGQSYETFYRYILGAKIEKTISKFFEGLSPKTVLEKTNMGALVIPFLYPNRSKAFTQWFFITNGVNICETPQVHVIRMALAL